MRVEIILCTPVGKKLNGAADDVMSVLDRAGVGERRVVDKSYAGCAHIYADVPETLFGALRECRMVICVRAEHGSRA